MSSTIPDRDNLEEMTRTDIQKLCKDNHIKANMRTDEMINALCDLANGMNIPRTQRSASDRIVSQALPKSRSVSQSTRTALQPSESNTDVESAPDAPTTRRKAKETQVRLGKGRPAIAGGSGARNITKASRRRTKASAMLREQPIIEEDENGTEGKSVAPVTMNDTDRPSSIHPPSPSREPPPAPSQLPTPAPSQPSYSLPSAQLITLEARIAQIEGSDSATRLTRLENNVAELSALKASIAELSTLKSSALQVPILQARLDIATSRLDTMVISLEEYAKVNKALEARVLDLEARLADSVKENGLLKDLVAKLDEGQVEDQPSATSVIMHSPEKEPDHILASTQDMDTRQVETHRLNKVLPNPSPSQPTLGKRQRCDTPDTSDVEDPTQHGKRTGKDVEREAIERVIRPRKKKARLDIDVDDEDIFTKGNTHSGLTSTSTPRPRQGEAASTFRGRGVSMEPQDVSMGIERQSTTTPPPRTTSPSGFFTVGRQAPTPLARKKRNDISIGEYLHLDDGEDVLGENDRPEASNANPERLTKASDETTSPVEGASSVRTPSPSRAAGPSNKPDVNPLHDPNFFSGPLPVLYNQTTELPYPLNPKTPSPPDAQHMLEQSTIYATPVLGEPWQYSAATYANPPNISQLAESVGLRVPAPTTPGGTATGLYNPFAPGSSVAPSTPGKYTFRGGRRERNDRYSPFFSPGNEHRTGLTPTAFRGSLRSPAKMDEVKEDVEGEEESAERPPPQLRTMYGTELDVDTRFGEYGASLGKFDWGKYIR